LPNEIAELNKNADTNSKMSEQILDFLNPFDELWKMKKSSVITLARLEYSQEQIKYKLSHGRLT